MEDSEAYCVRVEFKNGDMGYSTEESSIFEAVIGDYLIVSCGYGNVRDLTIYLLRSGTPYMTIKGYHNELKAETATSFTYFSESTTPLFAYWREASGKWELPSDMPAAADNATFQQAVKRVEEVLTDGFPLAALQKYHVDLTTKKITAVEEYVWQYIE